MTNALAGYDVGCRDRIHSGVHFDLCRLVPAEEQSLPSLSSPARSTTVAAARKRFSGP